MRTHIDSYWPQAQIGWRVFRSLRDAWAGRIELQASSICPLGQFTGPDGAALADEVATLKASSAKSAGRHRRQRAPRKSLDRFFTLAEERALGLDLHIDETGDTRAADVAHGWRRLRCRRNFRGARSTVRPLHAQLALQPEESAHAETIRLCAEAGIAIVSLPMCNMYLQGRIPGQTPRWRGVTIAHEFAAAGVPVSFASDNCRDPFYAYGDYDMVEVHREAVRIAHLDHPFGLWQTDRSARPLRR